MTVFPKVMDIIGLKGEDNDRIEEFSEKESITYGSMSIKIKKKYIDIKGFDVYNVPIGIEKVGGV